MKKIVYIIAGAAMVIATSCKKYLDINQNPNSVTTSTPDLVMPQAIVGSASITYGDYSTGIGRDLMYVANAGGFSGFGTVISYDYTTSTFTAAWSDTYDNVNDYVYIKKATAGNAKLVYYNAVARIMSAYMVAMLVDQYDNIPYSQAWLGVDNVAPKYDKGTDIYKDLAAQIDTAITLINSGLANPTTTTPFTTASDPLYTQGATPNMVGWKQFANTVKLRLIVRAGGKVTFNNTNFSSDGFLTADATVNPGYVKTSGKISPIFPYSATSSASTSSRLPSTYVVAFYDGTKLKDDKRGIVTFQKWPSTPSNQLGNETAPTPPSSPVPNSWIKSSYDATGNAFSTATVNGTTNYAKFGIYKDYTQGVPLITAFESYFLQAEALVRGYITTTNTGGLDAVACFNKGIESSFSFLYKDATGTIATSGSYTSPATDATAYRAANPTSYLANLNLAVGLEQQVEAIITQKYIANNFVNMHEGWNEYRRTGYPKSYGTPGTPATWLASNVSLATRADKMPTRFPYPSTEYNTNVSNIPTGIDKFNTLIFWAK